MTPTMKPCPWIRRAAALALALVAAGCAGAPDVWVPQGQDAFVNPARSERRSAAELLGWGEKLYEEKNYREAIDVLGAVSAAPVEPALRERALFLRAQAFFDAGDPYLAHQEFDRYAALFPDSDRAVLARERMMACGLRLIREGYPGFIGLSTSGTGLELLRRDIERFPAEDFTDDYMLALADYHHKSGNLDEAERNLLPLAEEQRYRRTNSAPHAVLLLALIGLQRFQGIAYDTKPLLDAKRLYEKFLGDYAPLSEDSPALPPPGVAPETLAKMERVARAGIQHVHNLLAAQELAVARFYLHRGKPRSARLHLNNLLERYGGSNAADEARELERGLSE